MGRHLHIDPFSGIAGDMLIAGFLDLGAPAAALEESLNQLPLPGVRRVRLAPSSACSGGVSGLQLDMTVEPLPERSHSNYPEVRRWIERAPLPRAPQERALVALDAIAAAEARARGTEPGEVQFHGIGGFDTPLDLVGFSVALDLLEVDTVTISPIPLTNGQIWRRGRAVPCPSPETLELLQGMETFGLDLQGELVTPTGAALAAGVATSSPPPPMTLDRVGVGFGKSDFPSRPNCLRLFLGTRSEGPERSSRVTTEQLLLLEANIDDLPGEIVATLIETCLEAGALDAWLTPILMKKSRPAHVLRALVAEQQAWPVETAVFRHSSTLGIRRLRVERDALAREWREAETPWGRVRVKMGLLGDEVVNVAPEFDDCQRIASSAGIPLKEVYALVSALAPRR